MNIEHLSYSGMDTYTQCPEKFRLTKVEGVKESTPSWALIGGSAVHEVTEALDWTDFGLDMGDGTEFKAVFDRMVEKAERDTGVDRNEFKASGRKSVAWPDKENYDFWLVNGPKFVNNWREWLKRSPYQIAILESGTPAIEVEYDQAHIGEVPTKGYIDRILEHSDDPSALVIVDLKTGKTPKSVTQLATYATAMREKLNLAIRHGGYFMCRDGVMTGEHDLSSVMGPRLQYEFETAWRGIHAELFPPRPSMLCDYCGVRDHCYSYGGDKADLYLPFPKVKKELAA